MVVEPLNIEKEKKTNLKLALAVASIAVLGFFAIYALFFLTIFFSPFLLFRFFPFPSFTKEVIGLDRNLLIFSETFDFKEANYDNPPQKRFTLRIYNGESISESKEIKPFASLYLAEDKIYFFDKGFYRTFDMKKWEEFKNTEIGNNPLGAVGTGGIWILSTAKNKLSLKFITGSDTKDVTLPDVNPLDYSVCSSQLLYFRNELHFFWVNNDTLLWSRYDGKQWSKPEIFEDTLKNKAIIFKDKIMLISFKNLNKQTLITRRTYDGNSWTDPEEMDIQGTFLNIMPAIFKDRLIVFQQGLFSEKYYLIDKGKPEGPFNISKLSIPTDLLLRGSLVFIVFNIILFLFIFLISLLIRRYKLRTWRADAKEIEFASIFRRFLAKSLDSLIIMIPVFIPLYLSFRDDLFLENPFKHAVLIFYIFGAILLGSFLYHSLLEGTWGKTIGKKICGIIVLKEDFKKCTLGIAFLRNLMRIVDSFFYYLVGIIAITGTLKWQRLGDLVAGTVVVRDKR